MNIFFLRIAKKRVFLSPSFNLDYYAGNTKVLTLAVVLNNRKKN